MEILSPAGSLESVRAAVISGADAIYIGYGDFNARRNAKNFTEEEFDQAIDLCHLHGIKVFVTMNIVLNDRELVKATEFIKLLASKTISAVIVQDLGVLDLIKKIAPTLPVHASTQLTVHNLSGVIKARDLGFSRVVLSRELSFENIEYICKNSPIEIEIFVHGALCMSYSGQCYMSSIIGSRSGNRGLCAQPCRLAYSYSDELEKSPLLSLKDLSLINHVDKLNKLGVACLKIEGRMKRPEYTAVVTKVYSTVLKENRMPKKEELEILELIFSRSGFTDGYFTNDLSRDMFGVKEKTNSDELVKLHDKISNEFNKMKKSYPIDIDFVAIKDQPISIYATDIEKGEFVSFTGDIPEVAINKPSTYEQIETQISKTGGTIFEINNLNITLDEGLMIRASSINALRRQAIDALSDARLNKKSYEIVDFNPIQKIKNKKKSFKYTVEITKLSQISDTMYKNKPYMLYIPLVEVFENLEKTTELINLGFSLCLKIPRVITDNQDVKTMLDACKKIGIDNILVSNIGFFYEGFNVYGDYALNAYNSNALSVLNDMGVKRQTISFELKFSQIRDISKCVETEILGYGHQPLMIFESCAIKEKHKKCVCTTEQVFLSDRKNENFALMPEFGCRNSLLNSKPLHILDKLSDYKDIGIDVIRMYFSTEDVKTCDLVYNAYINNNNNLLNLDFTRGLYYRGTL